MEHCGGRGAISVRRSPKSVFTNISIWNMVCYSLGVWGGGGEGEEKKRKKKPEKHQEVFTCRR